MGSGKTQAMYKQIREHPERSYIFVTPYLGTIKDALDAGLDIREPDYRFGNKTDDLKYLLSHGYNIGCTHSLFLGVDDEILDIIQHSNYTLLIDEALDVIKPVNDLIENPKHKIEKGDAKHLLNPKKPDIAIDDYGRVTWCGDHIGESYAYSELEALISTGNVIRIKEQMFVWMFPPEIFHAFDDVIILSYLFEGSIFDAYLKINRLDYTIGGVCGTYAEGYQFCEKSDDAEKRKALAQLITIYDGTANAIGEKAYSLSANWYNQAKPSDLSGVRSKFNTFLKNAKTKMPDSSLMWTCYKDQRDHLRIDGAGYVRKLTQEESKAMEADGDYKVKELNKLRCFVACNARATNDYDDRQIVAYLVNRFYNPMIKDWFRNVHKIKLDEKRYALSEMIQWIWRSAIRNANLPPEKRKIYAYVPSKRMRELLCRWLDGEAV